MLMRWSMMNQLMKSTLVLSSGHRALSSHADVFRQILNERKSTKAFDTTPIPQEILTDLMESTRTAPSGFNTQPYVGILVLDEKQRSKLSSAMMHSNVHKVQQAPVIAVFAADLEPSKRIPRLQELELTEGGKSQADVLNLGQAVRIFAGEGMLTNWVKCAISTVASPVTPVPAPVPTIAWSYKQTMIAASFYTLAATSHGLGTCMMEGFDENRVKVCLDIPDRYSIPVIIATGYAQTSSSDTPRPSPRFERDELFYKDTFGGSF